MQIGKFKGPLSSLDCLGSSPELGVRTYTYFVRVQGFLKSRP